MESRMSTTELHGSLRAGALARFALSAWDRTVVLFRAWRNRRDVAVLLRADDRMLSDIGLTRQDVLGALANPVAEDPSRHLVRAREERRHAAMFVRRNS